MLLQVLYVLSEESVFCTTLVPTNSAIGVARPMAHGQAIIMTVIAMRKEDSVPIVGLQNKNVDTANSITNGTNILAILSTVFSISAFCD